MAVSMRGVAKAHNPKAPADRQRHHGGPWCVTALTELYRELIIVPGK
jgi:hypothetical protein